MTIHEVQDLLRRVTEDTVRMVHHTGSREIVDPPPMDTDDDYCIYVDPNKANTLFQYLDENGWENESDSYDGPGVFWSYRKNDTNFIITTSIEFYTRHRRATKLCKKLNLAKKEDRKAVFKAILYGT